MMKEAMKNGEMKQAKIHAERSVRQKNTALSFKRLGISSLPRILFLNTAIFVLAARIEAIAERLNLEIAENMLNNDLAAVRGVLRRILRSDNPNYISRLLNEVDQENGIALNGVIENMTPEEDVRRMMEEARDEADMKLRDLPPAETAEEPKMKAKHLRDAKRLV